MSHLFVEFNDFEYIKENVLVSDKVVKSFYVKSTKCAERVSWIFYCWYL